MRWIALAVMGYILGLLSIFTQQETPVLGTLGFTVGLSVLVFAIIKSFEGNE